MHLNNANGNLRQPNIQEAICRNKDLCKMNCKNIPVIRLSSNNSAFCNGHNGLVRVNTISME